MTDSAITEININPNEAKEQDARILHLRNRIRHCVCRYCGQPLSLRKITYSAYEQTKIEIFCEQCNRMEYGVEPETYKIAEHFVDEIGYDHYPELDESLRKRRMNIAIICNILSWGFEKAGLIDENGFSVELKIDEDVLGEALTLSEKTLEAMDKE